MKNMRIEELENRLEKLEKKEDEKEIKFFNEMVKIIKKFENGEIDMDKAAERAMSKAKIYIKSIESINEAYKNVENELNELY